jgi:hypothetical protein
LNVFGNGAIFGGTFTVTITNDAPVFGVYQIRHNGTISGGTFTVTSDRNAYGIGTVGWYGTNGSISGGEFIVTGSSAAGVRELDSGTISGGGFIVTGSFAATGVGSIGWFDINGPIGAISGGTFTVTGSPATGVGTVRNDGTISGGTFTNTGNTTYAIGSFDIRTGSNTRVPGGILSGGEFWSVGSTWAYGIGVLPLSISETVQGGTINVWGPSHNNTIAIENGPIDMLEKEYETYNFTYGGQEYTKNATIYRINDAILREIYDGTVTPTPTPTILPTITPTATETPTTTYTITPTHGEHGSISPATPETVSEGGTMTFTITPDPGYILDKILVNGQPEEPTTTTPTITYTVTDVKQNH